MDLSVTHPSVDLVELNNLVVSLRKKTKQAKVFVYRQLEKKKKKLQKKFDKSKNEVKLKTIKEEISKIKIWDTDRVTKAVLANELTVAQAGPLKNIDALLIARISELPVMKAEVARFRSKYPDWKDLAAYLVYKNSSGKFKKNKTQKFGPVLPNTVENFSDMESLGDDSDFDVEDIEPEDAKVQKGADEDWKGKDVQNFDDSDFDVQEDKEQEDAKVQKDADDDMKGKDVQDFDESDFHAESDKEQEDAKVEKDADGDRKGKDLEDHSQTKTPKAFVSPKEKIVDQEEKNKAQIRLKKDKKEKHTTKHEKTTTDEASVGTEIDNFFVFENEPLVIENEEIEQDNDFHNDFFCSVKNFKNFRKSCPQERDQKPSFKKKYDLSEQQKKFPVLQREKQFLTNSKKYHTPFAQPERDVNKTTYKRTASDTAEKQGSFPKKVAPDVHPSWAAKQKEKEKLLSVKPSVSSKIVFDDSD